MITDRITVLIQIRERIQLILTQLNLLGQYEVLKNNQVVGVIPSATIRYPMKQDNLNLRMKKNTGLELIVESEPQITTANFKFGFGLSKYYSVILDSYKENGGLEEGVTAIMGSNLFSIPEAPLIFPCRKDESGIIPARALISIRRVQFLENLTFQ